MPNAAEIEALLEALDDEYLAWSTYGQVIADHGEVRPFTNIQQAEGRHIRALLRLFHHYGLEVPANPYAGANIPRYATLEDACRAGVAGEIANGRMYDRLLACVDTEEIREVLVTLQSASQDRHLPAFRRCCERLVSGRHRPGWNTEKGRCRQRLRGASGRATHPPGSTHE
jgi:hypothetical protein